MLINKRIVSITLVVLLLLSSSASVFSADKPVSTSVVNAFVKESLISEITLLAKDLNESTSSSMSQQRYAYTLFKMMQNATLLMVESVYKVDSTGNRMDDGVDYSLGAYDLEVNTVYDIVRVAYNKWISQYDILYPATDLESGKKVPNMHSRIKAYEEYNHSYLDDGEAPFVYNPGDPRVDLLFYVHLGMFRIIVPVAREVVKTICSDSKGNLLDGDKLYTAVQSNLESVYWSYRIYREIMEYDAGMAFGTTFGSYKYEIGEDNSYIPVDKSKWNDEWASALSPELVYILTSYDKDMSELTVQNANEALDVKDAAWLIQTFANVERNADALSDNSSFTAWTKYKDQTYYTNSTYLKILAASSVYMPFVSHTGDEAFMRALVSLITKEEDEDVLLRQYTKARTLLKPLYYVEDTNLVTNTLNKYLFEVTGTAKRASVGGLLDALSSQASYSYFTVKGSLVKGKDGSWGFQQPVTSSDGDSVTGKVMESDDGSSFISASEVVSGNPDVMTSTLLTIGRSSGVGIMTTLVLNNCVRSIRNTSALLNISDDFLYVNPFGDIVTSDNLVILPAAANPIIYDVGLYTDYFERIEKEAELSGDTLSMLSYSPYAGGARNYKNALILKLRRALSDRLTVEQAEIYQSEIEVLITYAEAYYDNSSDDVKSKLEAWIHLLKSLLNSDVIPDITACPATLVEFAEALATQYGDSVLLTRLSSKVIPTSMKKTSGILKSTTFPSTSVSVRKFLEKKYEVPDVDTLPKMKYSLKTMSDVAEEVQMLIDTLPNNSTHSSTTDAIYGAYNPFTVAFMNSYPAVPTTSNGGDNLATQADVGKYMLYFSKGTSLYTTLYRLATKSPSWEFSPVKTDYETNRPTNKNENEKFFWGSKNYTASTLNAISNSTNEMANQLGDVANQVGTMTNELMDGVKYTSEQLEAILEITQKSTDTMIFGDFVYDYVKDKFAVNLDGNISVGEKEAKTFRAFDATRISVYRLLSPSSATVADEPVMGLAIYPYFISSLSGEVKLSTVFTLKPEMSTTGFNKQVVTLASKLGDTSVQSVSNEMLTTRAMSINSASVFPYNEAESASSDFLPAKMIAQNMYYYFTADLDKLMVGSNNPNLRDLFLFDNFLVEALQGVNDAVAFEDDVQLQDKLFDLENSVIGRRITELATAFEKALGAVRGVLGVPTLDSNALFATVANILLDYAPFIFVVVIAIFAIRFSRSPRIYNWMGTSVLALIGCYLFIFIIPIYAPVLFNSVGSVFSEGLVSKSIMFRLEKENTQLSSSGTTAIGLFDADTYNDMSSSITLYSLDKNQIKEIAEQIDVDVNSFRNGDIVVLDAQSGLYVQGNALKMNTDVLFKTSAIEGQTLLRKYTLRNVKLNSNVLDYYTPYYLLEDGFVETLSSYTNFFSIPRRSVSYVDGTQKDSFVVSSYLKSFPFLYSDLFKVDDFYSLPLEDQALAKNLLPMTDAKLKNLWDSFENSTDMLNMTWWIENPSEDMLMTQWYRTLKQNGYYEDLDGEWKREDLINYVNYQVKRYLFENQAWFDYVADDTIIKCVAMQATFYFNQRVSTLDNWIYPTRYNQEDITVTDAYMAISAVDSEYLLQQETSLAEAMYAHYSIGGSIIYILLSSLTACFSIAMTFAFPLMYIASGVVILVRLVIGKHLQRTLATFVKSIGMLIVIFTAWLIIVSLTPLVLHGFLLYVVLTIVVGVLFFLTVLVYVAFVRGLLFGHDAFEEEISKGTLGAMTYAPRTVSNWLTTGIIDGNHDSDNDLEYDAAISGTDAKVANRNRILSAIGGE